MWDTTDGESIGPAVQSITASVTRLGCNNGVTGQVAPPHVERTSSEIIITFLVEPPGPGDLTCPLNERVPVVIDLGEPLGDRLLVDGACVDGEAVNTSFCRDGSARYAPA